MFASWLCVLWLGVATPQDDPTQEVDPPADPPAVEVPPEEVLERRRAWQKFPVFMWMESGGPELSALTLRTLNRHHLGGVNVESHQSSLLPAVERAPFYIGHLAGKGDLHMRREVFEAEQQKRMEDGHRAVRDRPVDLLDPKVLTALIERIEAGILQHQGSRPLAYSLEDEPSITYFINPFDYSHDPTTLRQMNQWLQTQYVDLDHLNEVWEKDFATIAKVKPESTELARKRNGGRKLRELNFASWSDHRAFMDVLFAGVIKQLTQRVAALAPTVPVGFLGGQAPSAFGGYDWWQLAKVGTFFEAYDHGMAPELLHAFKLPGTKVVSTLFLREDGRIDQDLGVNLYRHFARGDDGAVVWSSARAMTEKGEIKTGAEALGRHVEQVREAGRLLKGMRPTAPQVAIYMSQASVRAGWMLDSWEDGPTWVNRLTSYENERSTTIRTREAWGTILRELAIPFTFVDSRDFVDVGGAEYGVRIIVLNEAMALSDEEVHELIRFVASGGLLIGDAHAALFDERLRGRNAKAFTALFGVSRPVNYDWSDYCRYHTGARSDTTQYLGMRRAERGIAIVEQRARPKEIGFVRSVGLGHTLYLNLDVRDWDNVADRRAESAESFREQLLAMMTDRGGLSRSCHLDAGRVSRKIHVVTYGNERVGACVLIPAQTPFVDVEFELYFPEPVQLFNPATGRSFPNRERFSQILANGSMRVLRWERLQR